MSRSARRTTALALGVVAFGTIAACSSAGGTRIEGAWARATGAVGGTGVVYMEVVNDGDRELVVTGVTVPARVAASAVLHRGGVDSSGMARMRTVRTLRVPPGGSLDFSPGASHVMLVDIRRPLHAGESFRIRVQRAGGPPLTSEVQVRGP